MLLSMRKPRKAKPALPRAPLPRQRGGAHPDESKRLERKKKHKRALPDDTEG